MFKPNTFSARKIETGVKYGNYLCPGVVYLGTARHGLDKTGANGVGKNGRVFKGSKKLIIIDTPEGDEHYIGCLMHPKNKQNKNYWNNFFKI